MFAMKSMPPQAMQAGWAAEEIFAALVTAIRPGMVVHELYDIAVAKAAALGYGDRFLGPQDHQVSFVGHGIGLELVEPPIVARGKREILEAGMVLALEPKIVFENHFCAGVESVVAVTAKGARLLTRIPQETFIC
jgi:Xaa-Pro aminopeptidase